MHDASHVLAFAISCHALSSLSSQLIPIGSLQRENRLATIDGHLSLSLSLSFLSSSSPLDLWLANVAGTSSPSFLQLGTAKHRRREKKKTTIQGYKISIPLNGFHQRRPTTMRPLEYFVCVGSARKRGVYRSKITSRWARNASR